MLKHQKSKSDQYFFLVGGGGMVFDTIFNNISVISRWSVLLVDETGVPEESHWQTLSHNECCIEYNSPEHDSNSQL